LKAVVLQFLINGKTQIEFKNNSKLESFHELEKLQQNLKKNFESFFGSPQAFIDVFTYELILRTCN
jgi:hypothetical protein